MLTAAALLAAGLLQPGCTCRSADAWAQNARPMPPAERITVAEPSTTTQLQDKADPTSSDAVTVGDDDRASMR